MRRPCQIPSLLPMLMMLLICILSTVRTDLSLASGQDRSHGILVVGKIENREMLERESEILALLERLRVKLGAGREVLPILTYHIDLPREKAHCENVLGIRPSQCLYAAVVEHSNLRVSKVLMSINSISNNQEAATLLMTKAALLLGKSPAALRPAPDVGKGGGVPGREGYWELSEVKPINTLQCDHQIIQMEPRNVTWAHTGDGFRFEHHHTWDGINPKMVPGSNLCVTVEVTRKQVHNPNHHAVEACTRAWFDSNQPGYAGTPIELGSVRIDAKETSQPRASRMNVVKVPSRTRSGKLQAFVSLSDGSGSLGYLYAYDWVPTPTASTGGVELVKAYVTNGATAGRILTSDRSLHVIAHLRNLSRRSRHEHIFVATLYDYLNRVRGWPLGGKFVVEPGETLEGKTFPACIGDCDGFLVSTTDLGQDPGSYRWVLQIDGEVVKVLPFSISPP